MKLKTQKPAEDNLDDSVGGKFVLLRKEEPINNGTAQSQTDRKRKLQDETGSDEPKKQKLPSVPKSKQTDAPQLKDKLINQLKGSRFRYLNEVMYSSKGSESAQLFKEDPSAFSAYHDGYRQQIAKWPMNPLQRIIKSFKKLPKNCVVADFGCGDALLAKSIPHQVYSLDLVAATEGVIECDMAKTPLETASVDVAVYCLSLMGTNLMDFFAEANRVLKAR
jgi:ribosomal RNA-processing protein 8